MLNWTASRSTIAAPQQQCYGTQAYLPDVAITLNNLAVLYRATQRMKEAEDAYREALSIRRQLAKANPGVAGFWNPSKQQPVAFDMFQGAVPPTQERRMSGGRVECFVRLGIEPQIRSRNDWPRIWPERMRSNSRNTFDGSFAQATTDCIATFRVARMEHDIVSDGY